MDSIRPLLILHFFEVLILAKVQAEVLLEAMKEDVNTLSTGS
jgi:hypothetical protein